MPLRSGILVSVIFWSALVCLGAVLYRFLAQSLPAPAALFLPAACGALLGYRLAAHSAGDGQAAQKRRREEAYAEKQLLLNLRERMKELHCLYSLSEIIEKRDHTLDDVMRRTVALIPPALQHSGSASARITLSGQSYRSENFEESPWRLEREITADETVVGRLSVFYRDVGGDGRDPFLVEEKALVNAIAERLGKAVERAEALKRLRESEERFRILVENSLTGISIVQGEEIVYQNREQERILGPLPRASILGDDGNVHPEDIPRVKRFRETLAGSGRFSMDVDFRYSSPDGEGGYKWVHCRANRVSYRNRPSLLFNLVDVTRTKKLENLLVVQDKMASLGRVAAGIAHEIRNPLSGINIYLNTLERLIERGECGDNVKSIFERLAAASGKIESVIRRVMDFSRPSEPHLTLADINVPVRETLNLTRATLTGSEIEIETDLGTDLPRCRIDAHQVEEVILNIVTNAADAMKAHGGRKKISVVTAAHEGQVAVRIIDTGPGIPPENREKIFDPFFTTKSDSTGIGLSICHRIVTDHGGKIEVRAAASGGTEFRILFPAGREN